MSDLFQPLSDSEIKEINEAIEEAEKFTCAEICPMIIKKVDNVLINKVRMQMKGIQFVAVVVVLHSIITPHVSPGNTLPYFLSFPSLLIAIYAWFAMNQKLQKKLSKVVNKEADKEFENQGIAKTLLSNGVFLFISMEDRRVVVLADKFIKAKTTDETWVHIVSDFQNNVKSDSLANAIKVAIKEIGEIARTVCPKSEDDQDELKNEIIIKG